MTRTASSGMRPLYFQPMSTFLQNFIAFGSAASGALVAASLGVSHRNLCALISIAAGSLLATTFFHIVPEQWTILSIPSIFIALASGYLLFYLISRYVFHVCPACAASHFEDQSTRQSRNFVLLLAIALTVHNLMDGMAIAIGGKPTHSEDHSIFATVTIHKFPEGLALCALLLKAGYEKKKALLVTLLFESATLLGWAAGALLAQGLVENRLLSLLLVHIGGGFVYLAIHAVINESEEHSPRFVILFFLAGIVLMAFVR